MLAGIVYAPGCVPGELCTAHFVPEREAKEIKKTSDFAVAEVRVPKHQDAHGHATLHFMVVNTDQAKHQPADGPVTFKVPLAETTTAAATAMAFDVALADKPDEPMIVPVENLPPATEEQPHKHASAPPVIPDSGICVVHDTLSGNGHATKIGVNGTDVPVFVESPSLVAFKPGDAAQTGKNEFTVTDDGTTKTYEAWDPALAIEAISCKADGPRRDTRPMLGLAWVDGTGGGWRGRGRRLRPTDDQKRLAKHRQNERRQRDCIDPA